MLETGTKIRKARLIKEFTQDYVAKQLGISQEAYSKIEANKTQTDYKRLDAIARILDMTVDELLTIDEKKSDFFTHIAEQQYKATKQSHNNENEKNFMNNSFRKKTIALPF